MHEIDDMHDIDATDGISGMLSCFVDYPPILHHHYHFSYSNCHCYCYNY